MIAIFKLLGTDYKSIDYYSFFDEDTGIDSYTRVLIQYDDAIATGSVGLGVKKEGELIVAGTHGYIYVPAPWWKTEYFEVRFENQNLNEKYFFKFDEDGLRYELVEFYNSIVKSSKNMDIKNEESIAISKVIEDFSKNHYPQS